ncbi:MAG TPA: SDR family NAD(P)-dependent oxidoreductase [Pseudonocardiaceae bacterium]|jgi:NAD(P)-dependent dehydrogenase (short-subunit alcohol dehydrogenase family)|nr:SDR family NAD(P)-dependent oxidoreductase [Pseudonocardiaceae bacterium]
MAAPPERGGPLAGRTVFVAGATGTVGTAVSETLARHGAHLVLHSHHPSAELRERFGADARYVHGDITEPDQIGAIDIEGPLHGIVNCVTGFDGRPQPLAALNAKEFRRVVDVDLVGSFVLVTELLPRLASGARIVLFSSVVASSGRPAAAHLCAAKGGVQGLARGLARDLAPRDIRVRVVAPGPVGPHPGLPSCTPTEVADVVLFLSSASGDGVPDGDVITVLGTKES